MGAVAHHLELAGVATTGISLIREQTEAMRVPRFLWVPFELGRPFGAPNEPAFQRRVLHGALRLLERTDGPPVLEDFPDEAPEAAPGDGSGGGAAAEEPWSCPVSFRPPATAAAGATALGAEVGRELALLAPWFDRAGRSHRPSSGLTNRDALGHLEAVAGATGVGPNAPVGVGLAQRTRLVCDDLHAWYLTAAAQQPGRRTSAELNHWFWSETALAHLIGRVAAVLWDDEDPVARGLARAALVPRRYQPALVGRP